MTLKMLPASSIWTPPGSFTSLPIFSPSVLIAGAWYWPSPRVTFSGEKRPSEQELHELHEIAHKECFIANSLNSEIVVEAPATV